MEENKVATWGQPRWNCKQIGPICPHIDYCGCCTFCEPEEREFLDAHYVDGTPRPKELK